MPLLHVPEFQSTHSVGSGTDADAMHSTFTPISIHPLRGEWDQNVRTLTPEEGISIHPLRGEWDGVPTSDDSATNISIHPLRGERDAEQLRVPCHWQSFQSTHSVGSGTLIVHFPLSPIIISIHPLRGEWDKSGLLSTAITFNFNPPTPWGVGRKMVAHGRIRF